MSSCTHLQEIVNTIINDVYPALDSLFNRLNNKCLICNENEKSEEIFRILQNIRSETISLKNYEIKLIFPRIYTYFENNRGEASGQVQITELYHLLKKKEDHIKEQILALELELDDEENEQTRELINFFKDHYFYTREKLYRCIVKLQRERAGKNNDDDSLSAGLINL